MTAPRRLGIVHVDTGRSMRGGQRQLLLLARGLRHHGHTQLIACPEGSPLEAAAHAEHFATLALPRPDPGHARGIRRLRRRLRQENWHIIHAHDGVGQTIAWIASLGTRLRRVAHRRVTFLPARKLDYRLKYRHTAHAVIAVSEFVKSIVIGAGIDSENVVVIPDGIELPETLPTAEMRARVRASWGVKPEHFAIGLFASSAPEKGQDIAEGAMDQLGPRLPLARLVVAGPLPSRHSAPESHGGAAEKFIVRLGYQNDLDEYFAGLDLFLMPSRSEGLGSSALLAMARGVPVIATRVGGLPEIVINAETGWLAEPESAAALAEAIISAARNRNRLDELGRQAARFAGNFSAARMTERTEALYCEVLSFQSSAIRPGRQGKPSGTDS